MQNSASGKFLPRLTFQIPREAGMIMKFLTVFILAACIQVHARVGAQTVTYSVKNAPIEKVFKEIKRQTGYGFMYNSHILEVAKPVTIEVDNKALKEVLDACFKDQPFTYELKGTTVVVKEKLKSDETSQNGFFEPVPLMDVHGRVTDSVGNPLNGASVKVKGVPGKGTVTDENGEFTIKQIDNNSVLVIEFVGYGTKEYSVANRPVLIAILKVTNKELAEVAIQSYSSGYQRLGRNQTPGSVAFVNNELVNRRVSTDIMSRLEGIVPGILFTKNAASGTDITVRGRSTLMANASPLIVVDNFPYDGDINNINPNDVESITILKDANAASIWGVQSGNGVIVITTKRGKLNKPMQVQFNTSLTIGAKPDLFYDRSYMNSSDFIEVEKSLFAQKFYDPKLTDPNHGAYSPVVQILADERAGLITSVEANSRIDDLKRNDTRTELSKYFYQKSINQQYAVSFAGGNDKADYYFSVGYDQNRTNQVLNTGSRLTLNSNNNFYLLKNLSVSVGILYTQSTSSNKNNLSSIGTGGAYAGIYPYASFEDANGKHLPIVKRFSQAWVNDATAMSGRLGWLYYPLDELGRFENRSNSLDNKINTGLKYNFLKMFAIDLMYQYESQAAKGNNYYSDSSFYARDLYNSFYNPSGSVTTPVPLGGILETSQRSVVSHRGRAQLDFNKTFQTNHNLAAFVGAEISQVKGNYFTPNTMYGYNDATKQYSLVDFLNFYPTYPNGQLQSIPNTLTLLETNNRLISYFGKADYIYKKRYSLSLSGRIDKSNLFGVSTNQKSVPLYSVGGAWEFSQERFYHISWMPYLKLRITHGYNGNVNNGLSAVPTIAYLNSNNNFYFPVPFALIVTSGNPLLRWEKIRITNFAVDYASKNNIVSGRIEYYLKKGLDIFGTTPLAPSTGNSNFIGNTANIKGHGLELEINALPIRSKKFSWSLNFLFSNEISTVSKYLQKATASSLLGAGADGGSISPIEGKPIFGIYSYRSGPLTSDKGDPQGYIGGKLSTDYASIIGKASPDSLVFHGSARPTVYGSLRNNFSYKGFNLSFNITYKLNYYFRRSSIDYYGLFNSWNMNADFVSRWQKPGDESNTIVPSMPTLANLNSTRDQFYGLSDKLVDKGDHVRLQDITLSYEVNTAKIFKSQTPYFKTLRIYSYINNVGILWRANKDKLDPDVYTGGIPNPRTYAIGLQASF